MLIRTPPCGIPRTDQDVDDQQIIAARRGRLRVFLGWQFTRPRAATRPPRWPSDPLARSRVPAGERLGRPLGVLAPT